MIFTYVVNVYSDMSLFNVQRASWVLGGGGGGEASKNKLKDTSIILPMTNVTRMYSVRMRSRNTVRF